MVEMVLMAALKDCCKPQTRLHHYDRLGHVDGTGTLHVGWICWDFKARVSVHNVYCVMCGTCDRDSVMLHAHQILSQVTL